jgi:quinol monooxygenase YgiN
VIIVSGSIPIQAGKRESAFDLIRPFVATTRAEEGNRAYRMTPDLDDPGLIHLYEEWESEETMAAHGKAEHFTAFMGDIVAFVAGAPTINRYDVTGERPLF